MLNLKMETSLQNILSRINTKLKDFVGESKNSEHYLSQTCLKAEASDNIATFSEKTVPSPKNMSIITRNLTMKNYLNESDCFKRVSKINVYANQEQDNHQYACQDHTKQIKSSNKQKVDKNEINTCFEKGGHQENFLSLRKRNQTLQNDIKKLQSRLKSLQGSIKGSTQKKKQKMSQSSWKNADKKAKTKIEKIQKNTESLVKISSSPKISFIKSKYMKNNCSSSNFSIPNQKFNKLSNKHSSQFREVAINQKIVKICNQNDNNLKKKNFKKVKSSDTLDWDKKVEKKVTATEQNSFQSHSSYLSPIQPRIINMA